MAALSFEARLASANSAFTELCTLSEGLAPCVYQYRVQCAAQAIRDVAAAAYEQSQRDKATLVLCSAYLTLAQQDGNTSVKQQLSFVQQAFFTLVEADKQHASGSTASQYKACIEVAQQILAELDGADLDAGLSFWSRLVESIPRQWRTLRRVVSSKQAAWILQQGLRCMAAAADYKTGLKCGHEAAGPAELAVQCARFCGSQSHIQNSEKLKKDIWTFIWCTCESVQARTQADILLASFGSQPHVEQVWQVVDKYTQALRQTEEMDLLNECRAHARLGIVFDKHLNLPDKAMQNCRRAIQLGLTLKPRPVGEDWFTNAEAILIRIQLKQKRNAEEQETKEKAAILQELRPQLDAINAAKERGARPLLVHLKANHPPKFKSRLPEPDYDDLRNALRKASTDYHPDRQTQGDAKWRVLSEEISKYVNDVYAGYCS